MYDVLVKNGKLVTPDRIYEADIAIQDGKYAGFFAKGAPVDAKEVIDAKGNYVFPGIIDQDLSIVRILRQVQEQQLLQVVQH